MGLLDMVWEHRKKRLREVLPFAPAQWTAGWGRVFWWWLQEALTSMRYLGRRSVALSQKPPCRILAVWAGYRSRMPAAQSQDLCTTAVRPGTARAARYGAQVDVVNLNTVSSMQAMQHVQTPCKHVRTFGMLAISAPRMPLAQIGGVCMPALEAALRPLHRPCTCYGL